MSIEKFDAIYQRAAERKGGEDQLEALLSHPLSKEELAAIPNDRWLAAFSMKVFQSGISWSVVRKKWPNFEEVFFGFKIEPLLMLSDEQWETKATDERIIRHLTKVMSIPANARMIHEASIQHGSFGKMVADWPQEKITELWAYLKNMAAVWAVIQGHILYVKWVLIRLFCLTMWKHTCAIAKSSKAEKTPKNLTMQQPKRLCNGKKRAVVASPKSVKSLHLVPAIIDSNDKLISTLALITVCFFWPYL